MVEMVKLEDVEKTQKDLPKAMQDSKVKTTVRDMSQVIKEKMMQLQDMATMEVLLDTGIRMKNRLESIKKISSAQHMKIRGIWKTTAPQMHISKLEGRKINNDEYEIIFGVFDTDAKGNKILFENYAEIEKYDGSKIKRVTSAEYRVKYEVIERIKTGKPITREVVNVSNM